MAVPESWIDVTHVIDLVDLTAEFKAAGKTFRVSTKYPSLVRGCFRKWGIYHYQLIPSDGALELHPSLGIADIIVDLTSSGTTLKDNRLREIEGGTVLDSASCLIGHAPSLRSLAAEGDAAPLAVLLDAIDGVRASEGMLHLEVVGGPAAGADPAARVAAYLRDSGARHVARGEVWGDDGNPGWAASRGAGHGQDARRIPPPVAGDGRESRGGIAGAVRLRSRRRLDVRSPGPVTREEMETGPRSPGGTRGPVGDVEDADSRCGGTSVRRGSVEGVARDQLAAVDGAEGAPGRGVDAALGELHRAVHHQEVDRRRGGTSWPR